MSHGYRQGKHRSYPVKRQAALADQEIQDVVQFFPAALTVQNFSVCTSKNFAMVLPAAWNSPTSHDR
jgi:hypothetical protein